MVPMENSTVAESYPRRSTFAPVPVAVRRAGTRLCTMLMLLLRSRLGMWPSLARAELDGLDGFGVDHRAAGPLRDVERNETGGRVRVAKRANADAINHAIPAL